MRMVGSKANEKALSLVELMVAVVALAVLTLIGWAAWEMAEPDVAAEGIQAPVPYRGSVRDVLQQLLAGLRSGMSYCDASNLEEMWRNARFVRQTQAGIREGRSHNIGSY